MGASADINRQVAEKLREVADLLEQQGGSGFRTAAYRRAAQTIERLSAPVTRRLEQDGVAGLIALSNIGPSIAQGIAELIHTGRWGRLDRLRGSVDPEKLFQTIPAIGPELAARIHEDLHVDTLEALEVAAYDGRLESVEGIGPRRAEAIRAGLAKMLARVRAHLQPRLQREPSVELILDVDREYRERQHRLKTINPRRFNPDGRHRLPILHTERGSWHFTALFSNTSRAHQLGRTQDWVVIFFYDRAHQERQHTVVTEHAGPLDSKRVVRGREAECAAHYAAEAIRRKEEADQGGRMKPRQQKKEASTPVQLSLLTLH